MVSIVRRSAARHALQICAVLYWAGGAGCSSNKPPADDTSPNAAPDDAGQKSQHSDAGGLFGHDAGTPGGGAMADGGPMSHAGDGGTERLDGGDAGPTVRIDPSSIHGAQSWPVCRLVGPNIPGVGGTDLGFSVPMPTAPGASDDDARLVFLFGDTWARAIEECRFPPETSDDLQASIPAARASVLSAGEPGPDAQSACDALEVTRDRADDATSWRSIRLYEDASGRSPDKVVDTSFLRTPVTGFSDGEHTYVVILRNEPAYCDTTSECPNGSYCSTEADQYEPDRPAIGTCPSSSSPTTSSASPAFCVIPSRCDGGSACAESTRGMCLARTPFTLQSDDGPVSPAWFDQDPRRALLHSVYIASAFWPDRPEDYATGHTFVTRKFFNAVARAVAHFDPDDPSENDYRPGHETLLMWGRPTFFSSGGDQSSLFLLYQPLADLLDADGKVQWKPRFFAGYDGAGKPSWSDNEADAQPLYGAALETVGGKPQLSTADPEFDLVNHDAITWVESLQRWIMLYGGSVPDWLRSDTASGAVPAITNEQPTPNAIHMRTAAHPWGRATLSSPDDEAWTAPEAVAGAEEASPLLVCDAPEATPSAGCVIPQSSAAVLASVTDWAMMTVPADWQTAVATCVAGNTAYSTLYGLEGSREPHLYGTNIVDAWTDDVTAQIPDLDADERAVELYWNVSTWAPYQVVLMKTQLRARVR